ncbi:MAG: sigma-70 family RNA polymerase sigma factor [bacterium]|nr:sigma-70 family RNA polymerase sigma factor [bacterium]
MSLDARHATELLNRMHSGDVGAADELFPLLYEELRNVAGACMARERTDHTLQPTELVHEIWLRTLSGEEMRQFNGRAHFVRAAARAMRHVLVDHARARQAQKRGSGEPVVALDAVMHSFEDRGLDVVELNDALEWLQSTDAELARMVELRYFAGLSIAETAEVLDVSTTTVERGWRVARTWLRRALPEAGEAT